MIGATLKYILAAVTVICCATALHGQKYPERSDIRAGNRLYNKARYAESEESYRRAVEKNPDSFEARYNLGSSLYRQGEWEGAEAIFSRLTQSDSTGTNRFDAHFNSGNAKFQQRKLEEALEEYKQALRIDPDDMEAKFNLAYVKKMLEKDQDEDGGDGDGDGDDNDDQNQDGGGGGGDGGDGDRDQDRNQDPDGDGQDNGQGDNDNTGGDDKDNGPDKPGQGQNPPRMSREEAENLLEAMQMNEDKTREKMDEQKAKTVQRSAKNW